MVISRSVLLRLRNVSDKSCRENQNSHFVFNPPPRKSLRLRDNVVKYGTAGQTTDDNITQCMRFASYITKTRIQTHTLRIFNTGLFKIIVGVLTTFHTQYT